MKFTQVAMLIVFALPATLSAESYSRVETSVFTSSSADSSVESHVQTSGNAEVWIYTVINGEVVEDVRLEGEDVVFDSKHSGIEEAKPLSSQIATELLDIDKTMSSSAESDTEKAENNNPEDFIQLMSDRDFFLKSWGIDYFAKENNDEKVAWSASLFSIVSHLLLTFFNNYD